MSAGRLVEPTTLTTSPDLPNKQEEAKPKAVPAERLSGVPPMKELLCAYPRQL